MAANPLAPNPETDIDGPDVRHFPEPYEGERENQENIVLEPGEVQEDLEERVPVGEEGDV